MDVILGIILQAIATLFFLNLMRMYVRNGSAKKKLHVYGILSTINSYVVHIIFLIGVLRMKNAAVFDLSDPIFELASQFINYGLAIAQFGTLMFCLIALELLTVVIDAFQQQKMLKRIRLLKWFTFLFYLMVMAITIGNITNPNALPLNVRLAISYLLFLWPCYGGTLQMTVLMMLLKHLMKAFEKYVLKSPQASRKLMKVLRIMIFLNIAGMLVVGIGLMNFHYKMIEMIPAQWNIIIMMLGFNVFFAMMTFLAFFIYNIKHVVATDGISTNASTGSPVAG
jgi:hypothetical protein